MDETIKSEAVDPSVIEEKSENTGAGAEEKNDPEGTKNESTPNREDDTDRKKWDFTNRKVMVKNTLKYVDKKKLQKMIDSWVADIDVRVCKTKKPPRDNWCVLTLEKEEQVQIFIDHVNSNNFTNKKGEKVVAVRIVEDGERREDEGSGRKRDRKRGNEDEDRETKRQRQQRQVQSITPRVVTDEEVKNAMIPLWRNTYEEQLAAKEREIVRRCAIRVVKEIKDKFRYVETSQMCSIVEQGEKSRNSVFTFNVLVMS